MLRAAKNELAKASQPSAASTKLAPKQQSAGDRSQPTAGIRSLRNADSLKSQLLVASRPNRGESGRPTMTRDRRDRLPR